MRGNTYPKKLFNNIDLYFEIKKVNADFAKMALFVNHILNVVFIWALPVKEIASTNFSVIRLSK